MAEFITPEQRKGLLIGSLISAALGAGASLRAGGNITDALGTAMATGAAGYSGGVDTLIQERQRKLEENKFQEAIRHAKEQEALTKERLAFDKENAALDRMLKIAPLLKEQRLERQEEEERSALANFLREQETLHGTPESPVRPYLSQEQIGLLRAAPRSGVSGIIQEIIKNERDRYEPKPWQLPTGEWSWVRPGAPIPPGAKPLAEATKPLISGDLGDLLGFFNRQGEMVKGYEKKPSPNVVLQEQGKSERAEEKEPKEVKHVTWINKNTFEKVKVNTRDKQKMVQFIDDPDWMDFNEAMKDKTFAMKYKIHGYETMAKSGQEKKEENKKKPLPKF